MCTPAPTAEELANAVQEAVEGVTVTSDGGYPLDLSMPDGRHVQVNELNSGFWVILYLRPGQTFYPGLREGERMDPIPTDLHRHINTGELVQRIQHMLARSA